MFGKHTRRLVSGAVALAALLLLVVGLIPLFSNAHQLTTTNPTPTPAGPQLKMDGSITQSLGPIGSQQIPLSVRAPLPQLPDRVPLYEIKAAIDKPSPEVARAWAEKLGLGTVRVEREGESLEAAYVALT